MMIKRIGSDDHDFFSCRVRALSILLTMNHIELSHAHSAIYLDHNSDMKSIHNS